MKRERKRRGFRLSSLCLAEGRKACIVIVRSANNETRREWKFRLFVSVSVRFRKRTTGHRQADEMITGPRRPFHVDFYVRQLTGCAFSSVSRNQSNGESTREKTEFGLPLSKLVKKSAGVSHPFHRLCFASLFALSLSRNDGRRPSTQRLVADVPGPVTESSRSSTEPWSRWGYTTRY